jgi:hypothetical protein
MGLTTNFDQMLGLATRISHYVLPLRSIVGLVIRFCLGWH